MLSTTTEMDFIDAMKCPAGKRATESSSGVSRQFIKMSGEYNVEAATWELIPPNAGVSQRPGGEGR
jgi:hypothetical protein